MSEPTQRPFETKVIEDRLHHQDGSFTWYRRITPAETAPGALPLVVLHGGPGMAHNYLARLAQLTRTGREVILYDQVGCGRSSHHPEAPADHWQVGLYVDELVALVDHLDLGGGFHLLGQSWGGMLAPEYVLAHPDEGVTSLLLVDSPASMPAWTAGTRALLAGLSEHHRRAIEEHEAAQEFGHPSYLEAVEAFYRRHLCRLDPWPADLIETLEQTEADPTVYNAMIGPSEFTVIGSLADWSVADRVHGIRVPTLVAYGEFDEATDSWTAFARDIPDVGVHRFANASHTPHLETPDEFDAVVSDFLAAHDRPGRARSEEHPTTPEAGQR